jgi:hypothetical protein
MRREEAQWIAGYLASAGDISPLVELGSSTRHFRTVVKPHIDQFLHAPLRARGIRVVHTDIKAAEGVDISGNIYERDVRARLKDVRAKAVLCCNIFEHVEDRAAFAAICDDILEPGGTMVVSVPYSYPIHLDPIDNYFRPTPAEIAALFPGYQMIDQAIVTSGSYRDDFEFPEAFRAIAKSLLWRGGAAGAKNRLHRFLWLFRRYRISVAVLRKPLSF